MGLGKLYYNTILANRRDACRLDAKRFPNVEKIVLVMTYDTMMADRRQM